MRKHQLNPKLRMHHTGHVAMLPVPWDATVGLWCAVETPELYTEDGSGPLRYTKAPAYYQFKRRWGLRTRKQFERLFGTAPWALAHACLRAYVQQQSKYGDAASAGLVAHMVAREVGVLPVELLCRIQQIRLGCAASGYATAEWLRGNGTLREAIYHAAPTIPQILDTELRGDARHNATQQYESDLPGF